MKKIPGFFVFITAAVFFWGCVSDAKEAAPAPVLAPPEKALPQTARPLPEDGLGSPVMADIPPEAATYLKALSEAFRKRDGGFLFSQGEAQYEKETRPLFDEETYLAMLYRADAYAEEKAAEETGLPKLDYKKIRGIQYTGWTPRGPMLEISGRLHLENGTDIPCEILLAWRLVEPKIMGVFP